MKKVKSIKYFVIVIMVALVGCNPSESNISETNRNINRSMGNKFNQNFDNLDKLPSGDLNDVEIAGLLFMREEEKLAQDVYTKFFEMHDLIIFDNISHSEKRHTTAILRLIDRYDLEDPVNGNDQGTFTNEELQNLYDTLIEKGTESSIIALLVGAEIEEIDILDLKKYIDKVEDNEDIMFVYNNLLRGSRNHLRAFNKMLSAEEIVYEPQHLTQEEFEDIINSPMEKGNKGNGGHGQKGHKGNKNGKGGKHGRGGRG